MKKQIKQCSYQLLLVLTIIIMMLWLPLPYLTYADQKVKAKNVKTGNSGITIDGYYDDWEDKPMGTLTWRNNNGDSIHDVSFIKDDNYIYIYLKMHSLYQSPIPVYSIFVYVNNQQCQLFLGYANAQNTTDWSKSVNLNQNGIYLNLYPFTYYPNYALGDAAVTVSQGDPNDRFEIRVKISALENAMGLKAGTINNGSKLALEMPNVGKGSIQLLGTSSSALLGIALCIGFVIVVKLRRSYKMREAT